MPSQVFHDRFVTSNEMDMNKSLDKLFAGRICCLWFMVIIILYIRLGSRTLALHKVEECSKTTPQDRRRQTDDCLSGQASSQKGGQQLHPTRNHT